MFRLLILLLLLLSFSTTPAEAIKSHSKSSKQSPLAPGCTVSSVTVVCETPINNEEQKENCSEETINNYEAFDLTSRLVRNIHENFDENPTPVQSRAISLLLSRKDIIIQEPIDNGRTLAYLIPTIQIIGQDPNYTRFTEALIFAPTRALPLRIATLASDLVTSTKITHFASLGDTMEEEKIEELRDYGKNIVLGAPLQILSWIRQEVIRFGNLKVIVLERADEILERGFQDYIQEALDLIPQHDYTICFTAETVTDEVLEFAKQIMKDPVILRSENKDVLTGCDPETN